MAALTLAVAVGILVLVGLVQWRVRLMGRQIEDSRRLAGQHLEHWQTVSREVSASAEQIEHIRELLVALDRDLRGSTED